jgi:hypothetical protein
MTARRTRHRRPAVLAIVALVVSLVLAACNSAIPTPTPSQRPSSTEAPSSPSATPAPSEAPAASASGEPSAADPIYDEIEGEVAAMRGLEPTGPVDRRTIDEAELKKQIEQLYHEESPPELIAANERFYKALNLLPADASLEDLTIEMLSGGVAGFYRDDQKRLYVVSRSGEVGANEKITFAHEYNHALQDQHFPIFKEQEGVTNRTDWLMARQAVYEGDSSLLMTLWASESFTPAEFQELLEQGLNDPSTQMLERMPAILRETLLYPYTTGLSFVQGQYMGGGGWDAVDALYETVPETTEQVLHPDKYQAGEGPIAIELPDDFEDRIGPGWERTLDDTFGEFQTGVWLRDAGAENASEAAAGWGGDRVIVLEDGSDNWAAILATEWDSQADAEEFDASAGPVVDELADAAALLKGGTDTARWVVVASSDDVLDAISKSLGLSD